MSRRRALRRAAILLALGVVLLGSIIYLLVLAAGGAELLKAVLPRTGTALAVHDARPWLIGALGAGVVSLVGWGLAQKRLAALEGVLHSERESEQEARAAEALATRQLRESEAQRQRLERERNEERTQLARLARGWRSERDWNRELREQITRLHRELGLLADHGDGRQTVLELTLNLAEAEKGFLLSDRETAEGKLKPGTSSIPRLPGRS